MGRTRGMRHSRRSASYAIAGAGAQRRWIVDQVDDVKDTAADTGAGAQRQWIVDPSTVADCQEAELGEFLAKELSWCWKKFSTLDEPGTPRLLESELLCENDALAVQLFH